MISTMSAKVKAICKTLKHISQIFVVKERELEIGYPTDVKHVAHVGWDSPSDNATCWMNEFSSAKDHFAAHSLGDISDRRDSSSTAVTAFSTWSSQDLDQALVGYQPTSDLFSDFPQIEPPKSSKRQNSRARSSQSSARSSQAAKSISTFKGSRNL